ncbi:putative oxidoreductase OrdL [Tetrabaena socialis]|uniref:Putative oxidoreductase OrdL n=1 Tax=Tetrabaena socialis TaxID=47790 RepID=A0A2J8A5L8_9CHLO|nr:putative oxidoreductase OrdL [Tetrabaena socialis]|eukprot:PNH07797.1 putative oxidoreductase OrdL [Tetrabaena socialis]
MPLTAGPTPVSNPTTPYWLKALPARPRPHATPRAPLPPAADVVIIGGGIAGVSAAYHLRKSRPELKVVLLEARQLSHGATGRNGGLLWPALNAPWLKTVERYGAAEASRIMAFELQCLEEVTRFIQAEGLEEEVRYSPFRDGAFYVYENAAEMEAELAELAVMQKAGIHQDVKPLSRRQTAALLGTESYVGAVRQPGVARVWAARLVHALARMAAAAGPEEGLLVVEGTRVTRVEPLPDGAALPPGLAATAAAAGSSGGPRARPGVHNNIVPMRHSESLGSGLQVPLTELLDPASTPLLQVTTESGDSLLARRVLHCTNAYGSALLPELRRALVPVRNHVAATRAPLHAASSSLPDAAFYARGGYVYWSVREDGRVVIGGFRDVVPGMEWDVYDDGSLDERVRQHLHAYLPAHFPAAFGGGGGSGKGGGGGAGGGQLLDLEAEWSGILGFTQDRFPFVGPVPGRRGEFLAAGFSGHGMTRTFTCGRLVADMVAGLPLDPAFPPTWLPAEGRFGPALPVVPGPEAAAGALYI